MQPRERMPDDARAGLGACGVDSSLIRALSEWRTAEQQRGVLELAKESHAEREAGAAPRDGAGRVGWPGCGEPLPRKVRGEHFVKLDSGAAKWLARWARWVCETARDKRAIPNRLGALIFALYRMEHGDSVLAGPGELMPFASVPISELRDYLGCDQKTALAALHAVSKKYGSRGEYTPLLEFASWPNKGTPWGTCYLFQDWPMLLGDAPEPDDSEPP